MKIKNYRPKSELEAVGWLMEESVEVIQAIARSFRFGMETVHEGRSNRQILLDEIGDLKRSIIEAEVWLDIGEDHDHG